MNIIHYVYVTSYYLMFCPSEEEQEIFKLTFYDLALQMEYTYSTLHQLAKYTYVWPFCIILVHHLRNSTPENLYKNRLRHAYYIIY